MLPQELHHVAGKVPEVALSEQAQHGTYAIARVLMKVVDFLLRLVGLENNDTLFTILYACLVFLLSLGVGYVVTWIVVRIVRNVGKHWHSAV